MEIALSSFSNTGPRASNQDRVLLPSVHEGVQFVAAIADGIGGAAGGGEAAEIAINAVSMNAGNPADLGNAFSMALATLKETAEQNVDYAKMGTTLSIGMLKDGIIHVAHVGDTRIYHLRGLGLNTLTRDQTEIAELMRKGVLTENQAKRYPRRNVLLSALNPEGKYEIHFKQAKLEIGDRILFTTDGVHQRVKRGGILQSSMEHADIAEFISDIEHRTAKADPSDNFSAIGMQILAL